MARSKNKALDAGDVVDRKLAQIAGIVEAVRIAIPEEPDLPDGALQNALWAVADLLVEVKAAADTVHSEWRGLAIAADSNVTQIRKA